MPIISYEQLAIVANTPVGVPVPVAFGDTASEGVLSTFSKSDHRHPVPAFPSGRTSTYVIAASNSSARDKAQADLLCTGVSTLSGTLVNGTGIATGSPINLVSGAAITVTQAGTFTITLAQGQTATCWGGEDIGGAGHIVGANPQLVPGANTINVSQAGTIYISGMTDEAVLQAVLASGKSYYLAAGTYNWSNRLSLSGLTDVEIYADKNALITGDWHENTFWISGCTRVTIKGLQITNPHMYKFSETEVGIFNVIGSSAVFVRENYLYNMVAGVTFQCDPTSHVKCINVHADENEFYNGHYIAIEFLNGIQKASANYNAIHDFVHITGSAVLYAIASSSVGAEDTTSPSLEHVECIGNLIWNQDLWNAFDFHAGNHLIISHNIIDGIQGVAILYHAVVAGGGITVQDDVMISDNTVTNCARAIQVFTATTGVTLSNVSIIANVIKDCPNPIEVDCSAGGTLQGFVISQNVISRWTFRAINVQPTNAVNTTISDGVISENTIILLLGTYAFPVAIDVQGMGVSSTLKNVVVEANVIQGTPPSGTQLQQGVYFAYATFGRVANNLITGALQNIFIDTTSTLIDVIGNKGFIAAGEERTITIALKRTGSTLTNLAGTATGSPITLKPGANVVTVTADGTFTIVLPAGSTGTAASGTASVTGGPISLVGGSQVIAVTGSPGNITVTINAIGVAIPCPELNECLIKRIIVDESQAGGTATSVIQIGMASDAIGTGLGTEFFTAVNANSVAVSDSLVAGDTGTQTKPVVWKLTGAGSYVIAQIQTENAPFINAKVMVLYVGR